LVVANMWPMVYMFTVIVKVINMQAQMPVSVEEVTFTLAHMPVSGEEVTVMLANLPVSGEEVTFTLLLAMNGHAGPSDQLSPSWRRDCSCPVA
jgi:hypothetical protein